MLVKTCNEHKADHAMCAHDVSFDLLALVLKNVEK